MKEACDERINDNSRVFIYELTKKLMLASFELWWAPSRLGCPSNSVASFTSMIYLRLKQVQVSISRILVGCKQASIP